MFGNGGGDKILGLAKPQPPKPRDTDILTSEPLSFDERMRNTQNFLDNMRNDHDQVEEANEVIKPTSVNADRVKMQKNA